MPTNCAVSDCSHYAGSKYKHKQLIFHAFPRDKTTVKKWIESCRRADKVNPKIASICSDHFDPSCYERDLQHELLGLPPRRKLKVGAIPTVFPSRTPPSEAAVLRKQRVTAREETKERKRIISEILSNHEGAESEGSKRKSFCMLCCSLHEHYPDDTSPTKPGKDLNSKKVIQSLVQFGEHILNRTLGPIGQQQAPCNSVIANEVFQCQKTKSELDWTGLATDSVDDGDEDETLEIKPGEEILSHETRLGLLLESCNEDNISVCFQCMTNMKAATISRLEAIRAEQHVRKLQGLLLKELRGLQGKLEKFHRNVGIVEATLEKGDVSILKLRLNRKRRKTSNLDKLDQTCQDQLDKRREQLLQFRRDILEASQDVDLHRFECDGKISQAYTTLEDCNEGTIKMENEGSEDNDSDNDSLLKMEYDDDISDKSADDDDESNGQGKPNDKVTSEPVFSCNQCFKGFTKKLGLDIHKDIHKSNEEREQFVCHRCGKSFNLGPWVYHNKLSACAVVSGVVSCSLVCEICGKTLKNTENLINHMRYHQHLDAHTGPFTCKHCGKSLSFKANLIRHEKQHSRAKPYTCEHCGKAYTNSSTRRRHEKKCEREKIKCVDNTSIEPSADDEERNQESCSDK